MESARDPLVTLGEVLTISKLTHRSNGLFLVVLHTLAFGSESTERERVPTIVLCHLRNGESQYCHTSQGFSEGAPGSQWIHWKDSLVGLVTSHVKIDQVDGAPEITWPSDHTASLSKENESLNHTTLTLVIPQEMFKRVRAINTANISHQITDY